MSASLRVLKQYGPFNNRPFMDEQTISGGAATMVDKAAVAAAKASQLTTRTNATDGVITLPAAHGFVTGVFDIFWNVGGVRGHRRGVDGVVAVDALTISGGAGDDLPADESAVNVTPRSEFRECRFDGTDLKAIAAYAGGQGVIVLTGDDDAEDYAFVLPQVGADGWHNLMATANPVTEDVITKCYLSNGEVTTKEMRLVAIHGEV